MTSPPFIHFLKFVAADVQIVELGALEAGPLVELVVRNVQPLQVREGVFSREHCKVLDSIVRQVQLRQTGQVFESGDICQAVTTEVNLLDIFDLLTCLCQLLKLLALAHNLGQLHALSVISVIN